MDKFKKYIDKRFNSYPKSRQLDELKEELMATLTERFLEYTSNGIDEETAYKNAIDSIGDCKEAVKLIENSLDRKTKGLRRSLVVWGTALFWLLVSTIYLTVSLISKKWIFTWTMFPISTILYLSTILAIIFPKGKSLDKHIKVRFSLIITLLIATISIYLLVSFFTRAWVISWVIILIGLSIILIIDSILIKKKHKLAFEVYIHFISLFITTVIYQLIHHFKVIKPSLSWLTYLFAAVIVLAYHFIKVFIKYKSDTSFK